MFKRTLVCVSALLLSLLVRAANFPSSVSTDANLYDVVNNCYTSLMASINSVVTTLSVITTANFPSTGYVVIDNEVIKYAAKTSNSFTGCTRGADGTSATTHVSGRVVYLSIVADHHNVLKDEIIAIEDELIGTGTTLHIDTDTARVGVGTINPSEKLEVEGNIKASYGVIAGTGAFSGGLTAATLDTGHGSNELYSMDQPVRTNDNVTHSSLTVTNTSTLSGPVNVTDSVSISSGTILLAGGYAGATLGAKINNAMANLPSNGGVIDARGMEGPQTISSDPFYPYTKPVTLLLGVSTITITGSSGTNFWCAYSGQRIIGSGKGQTVLEIGTVAGASNSVLCSQDGAEDVEFANLTLNGGTAGTNMQSMIYAYPNHDRLNIHDIYVTASSCTLASIYITSGTHFNVENVNINATDGHGIRINNGGTAIDNYGHIHNCWVHGGDFGFSVVNGKNLLFENDTATADALDSLEGFNMDTVSDSQFVNVHAIGRGDAGFIETFNEAYPTSAGERNHLVGGIFLDNGLAGLYINSRNGTYESVLSDGNGANGLGGGDSSGVTVAAGSYGATVRNVTATNNDEYGVYFLAVSSQNVVSGIRAENNTTGQILNSGSGNVINYDYWDGSYWNWKTTGNIDLQDTAGTWVKVGGSDSGIDLSNGTQVIRLSSDGRLKLISQSGMTEVAGTIQITDPGTASGTSAWIYRNVSTGSYMNMFVGQSAADGKTGIIGYYVGDVSTNSAVAIGNYGDSVFTGTGLFIKRGGEVGIGTITPSKTLEVNGTVQGDYYSSDGTAGVTDGSSYWICTAADCSSKCQVTIKDGLITGCP